MAGLADNTVPGTILLVPGGVYIDWTNSFGTDCHFACCLTLWHLLLVDWLAMGHQGNSGDPGA